MPLRNIVGRLGWTSKIDVLGFYVIAAEKTIAHLREQLRSNQKTVDELWDALRIIRATVEEYAPLGSVKGLSDCHTPLQEAEALIEGITRLAQGGVSWEPFRSQR